MFEFFWQAIIAGIVISLVCGPVGSLIIWHRLSYLADSLGHSLALGVILAWFLQISSLFGGMIIAVLMAVLINYRSSNPGSDLPVRVTLWGQVLLATAILLYSLNNRMDIALESYLFGDLLLTNTTDLILIAVISTIILLWLFYHWRDLVIMALNNDLAQSYQINISKLRLHFLIAIGMLLAVSIKIFGLILISSLLVLPSAIARLFASSCQRMALCASVFGALAVITGILASYYLDTPTSVTIVLTLGIGYLFSLLVSGMKLA